MDHAELAPDFPAEGDARAIDISQIPQRSESARGSSAGGSPSAGNDARHGDQHNLDDNEDSDAGNRAKNSRPRKPHLQGRFSGRLETKQDERRLAEECKLLGPLLGGAGKRGEKSRLTLAKIVRGIASGEVRKYCAARERRIQELTEQLEGYRPRDGHLVRPEMANGPSALLKEESGNLTSYGAVIPASTVMPASLSMGPPSKSDFGLAEASAAIPIVAATAMPCDGPGLNAVAQVVSMAMPTQPAAATAAAQAGEAQALAHGAVQLKAQAQNFQAHAEQLVQQSKQAPSDSEAAQVVVQAQSFQRKAMSLEKAAQAQNLQAQAVVHAQAQAQAQAQAHHLVAQAHDHAQAYAHAAAKADHLKKVSSIGQPEIYEAHEVVVVQAQHLEHEAHSHAQAQTELTVQAHNLAAKAQAHAHAQAHAQAQAQQAAVEAHQLDAAAQQLQAEAQAVTMSGSPDKLTLSPVEHLMGVRGSQGLSGASDGSGGAGLPPPGKYGGIDLHAESARLPLSLSLDGGQGPVVSLTSPQALGQPPELQS